jgi:threonine/homoserine/homoserine lactone efflux protein
VFDYIYLALSGVVIGLIVAVPIGPVNLICIRRTLAFGPLNGFVSGLGAALGDTVFAIVTGFSLTYIAQLIQGYSRILELAGGAMLIYFGLHTYLAKVEARIDDKLSSREKGRATLFRTPWRRPSRSPSPIRRRCWASRRCSRASADWQAGTRA